MRNAQLVHQQSNRLLLLLAFTLSLVGLLVLARFSVVQAQQPAPQTVYLPLVVGVPPTNSHSPVGLTGEPPLQAPGTVVEWKPPFTVTLDTPPGSNDKEGISYKAPFLTTTTDFTSEQVCSNGKSLDNEDLENRRKALQDTYDDIVRGGLCVGRSATSGLFKAGLEKLSTFAPGQPYLSWADETKYTGILTLTSDYQSRQLIPAVQDLLRRSSDAGALTVTERLYRKMAGLPLPNGTTENWATNPDILLIFDSNDCNKGVGHALLPYKVEYLANEARIYVYDPNYPISETVYLIPDWDGPTGIPPANAISETETVTFPSPFAIRLEGKNIDPIPSRKVSWQWVFTYTKSIAPNDVWGIYAPSQVFTLTSKRDNTVLTPTVPLSPTWTRETGAFSLTWVSNFTLTKNLSLTHTWVITAPTQVVTFTAKDKAKFVKNPFAYNRYITVYKDNSWSYPFNSYDGPDGIWKNWSFYYIPVKLLQEQQQAEGMKKLGGPSPDDYSLLTGGANSGTHRGKSSLTGGANSGTHRGKSSLRSLTGGANSGTHRGKSSLLTLEPGSSSSSPKADLNRCFLYFSEAAFAPIVGGGGGQKRTAYGDPSATWGKDHKPFCFGQPRVTNSSENQYRIDGQNSVFNYEGTLNVTGTTCLNIRKDFESVGIYISGTQELTPVLHQEVRARVQHTYEDGATRSAQITMLMPLLKGEFITITLQGNAVIVTNKAPITKTVAMLLGFSNARIDTEYTVKPIDLSPNSRLVITAWDWSRLEDTLIIANIDKGNKGKFNSVKTLQFAPQTQPRMPVLTYILNGKLKKDETVYFNPTSWINLSVLPSTCPVAGMKYRLEQTEAFTDSVYTTTKEFTNTAWKDYYLPQKLQLPNGRYLLSMQSYDTISNTEDVITRTLLAYSTAPSTTITVDGDYANAVTVKLHATSYLSDVLRTGHTPHKTFYRLNGSQWQIYEQPLVIAQDGLTILDYYTADAAGYAEPPQTRYFDLNRRVVTAIPLSSTVDLASAYKSIFEKLALGSLDRSQASINLNGQTLAPGTLFIEGEVKGLGTSFVLTPSQIVSPTMALARQPRVAIIVDSLISQKEVSDLLFGTFNLKSVKSIPSNQVTSAILADRDLVIVPSVTMGNLETLTANLGSTGLAALRTFAQAAGKTLYLQGQSTALLGELDARFSGTVSPTVRISTGESAKINVVNALDPLTFNAPAKLFLPSDAPLLKEGAGLSATLEFEATNYPHSPAMLVGQWEKGRIVLITGNPAQNVKDQQYSLIANLLLTGLQEPLSFLSSLQQNYSNLMARNMLPLEVGATASITRVLQHNNTLPVTNVEVTDVIKPGFKLIKGSIWPTNTVVTEDSITWHLTITDATSIALGYQVEVAAPNLLGSYPEVARAKLAYQTAGKQSHELINQILPARMVLPANIESGMVNSRQDIYPLPETGLLTEKSLTIRNKEGTAATNMTFESVVPLLVAAIDISRTGQPAFDKNGKLPLFKNIIGFPLDTTRFPLPNGVSDWRQALSYEDWDGTTVYTLTVKKKITWSDLSVGTQNSMCPAIPGKPNLSPRNLPNLGSAQNLLQKVVKLIPAGDKTHLVLPAVVLKWNYGTLPGYDFSSPAQRFFVNTQEIYGRSVGLSNSTLGAAIEFDTDGIGFLTQLGTEDVANMLRKDWQKPQFAAPQRPNVVYNDLWGRTKVVNYPMDFTVLVRHAKGRAGSGSDTSNALEANLGYQIFADRNGDKVYETPVREFNLADKQVLLEATLIVSTENKVKDVYSILPIFKGVNSRIRPFSEGCANANAAWTDAEVVKNERGSATIDEVKSDGLYDYLKFDLKPQDNKAIIKVRACLVAPENGNAVEGPMKFTDGMQTTYQNERDSGAQLELFSTPPLVPWVVESGINLEAQVSAQVTRINDFLYVALLLQDRADPRGLLDNAKLDAAQYLKTEGSAEGLATVFVGGRSGDTIYYPWLDPNYADTKQENITNVRVYVVNTQNPQGDLSQNTWRQIKVTPDLSDTVTAKFFKVAKMAECKRPGSDDPIASNVPGLNLTELLPGQAATYQFKVTANATITEELRGSVYPVRFKITGENVPANLTIPPAMIGILKDGKVVTSYGPATDLKVAYKLASEASIIGDLHFSTDSLKFKEFWASLYDGENQSDSILASWPALPSAAITKQADNQTTIDLQAMLPNFPLTNATTLQNQAFLVGKIKFGADKEGMISLLQNPSVIYRDFQGMERVVTTDNAEVRANGGVLAVKLLDDKGVQLYPKETNPVQSIFLYGKMGEVTTTIRISNPGTKLLLNPEIIINFNKAAVPTVPVTASVVVSGSQVIWRPAGNIAVGDKFELPATLRVLTNTNELLPSTSGVTGTIDLIESIDLKFYDGLPLNNGWATWQITQPLPPYKVKTECVGPDCPPRLPD